MALKIFSKLLGSRNDRQLKRMSRVVAKINNMEPDFKALSDEALRAKTDEYRKRQADGESLDDLLPEAFAAVREAAWRTLEMRHFDVQLIGGMVLHQGKIAEMRTGEGKTLVATLAAYLNALSGDSVHVVTVNDYLARRDADWMGQVFTFMGMTTGVILSGQSFEAKKAAYEADITYGTITSSALIIYGTIWHLLPMTVFSRAAILPLLMKLIPFLSMRHEHRWLSLARLTSVLICTQK